MTTPGRSSPTKRDAAPGKLRWRTSRGGAGGCQQAQNPSCLRTANWFCSTIELREQWEVFRWHFEGPAPRSHGRQERHEHAGRVPRWWRMGIVISSGPRGHLALRSGHPPAPRALWAANRPMAGRPGLDGGGEPDPEFGSGVSKAPSVGARASCEKHLEVLCWPRSLAWQCGCAGRLGGFKGEGTHPRVRCPQISRTPGPF